MHALENKKPYNKMIRELLVPILLASWTQSGDAQVKRAVQSPLGVGPMKCPDGGPSTAIECNPKKPWPQCPPMSYCYVTNAVDLGPYYCCEVSQAPYWNRAMAAIWHPFLRTTSVNSYAGSTRGAVLRPTGPLPGAAPAVAPAPYSAAKTAAVAAASKVVRSAVAPAAVVKPAVPIVRQPIVQQPAANVVVQQPKIQTRPFYPQQRVQTYTYPVNIQRPRPAAPMVPQPRPYAPRGPVQVRPASIRPQRPRVAYPYNNRPRVPMVRLPNQRIMTRPVQGVRPPLRPVQGVQPPIRPVQGVRPTIDPRDQQLMQRIKYENERARIYNPMGPQPRPTRPYQPRPSTQFVPLHRNNAQPMIIKGYHHYLQAVEQAQAQQRPMTYNEMMAANQRNSGRTMALPPRYQRDWASRTLKRLQSSKIE